MLRDSRKALQTGTIPTPRDFRATTTGIGQTLAASQRTGAIRAQRVVESTPPQCAKYLPRSYPAPMYGEAGAMLSGSTPTGNPAPETPAKVRNTHPAVMDQTP